MIEEYRFGFIKVAGRVYRSDIIIFPDGSVEGAWRRTRGHCLLREDLEAVIASRPRLVVAGTGAYGLMKPAPELERQLEKKGILLQSAPTGKAVRFYNERDRSVPTAACFHLTC